MANVGFVTIQVVGWDGKCWICYYTGSRVGWQMLGMLLYRHLGEMANVGFVTIQVVG